MSRSSWNTFKTLFNVFCCPPLPSKITSKLAFVPPEPSYFFIDTKNSDPDHRQFKPLENAEWQFSNSELSNIDGFVCRTKRKEKIACLLIKPKISQSHVKYSVLFSHGNAVDIGQMSSFLTYFANEFLCNVFCYDYCGYGASSGSPSETNLYADIEAAYQCLMEKCSIKPENVILYGQSIGTAPTVELATKERVGGVVLHCPLMSGMRLAFPKTKDTWFCDAFASIDKVKHIKSPVLVIHGTEDEVIHICHGQTIFEKCPKTVDPLWVSGAGHNDIEVYPVYMERMHKFMEEELPFL